MDGKIICVSDLKVLFDNTERSSKIFERRKKEDKKHWLEII